jgi:putative peptide zinc metalloprotease protein
MLPGLRQDLTLHSGPAAQDGSPTWLLHDPAANRFYQLSWPAFEILSRWSLGDAGRIVAAVNAETTLAVDAEDLDSVICFLAQCHLIDAQGPADTARLMQAVHSTRSSKWRWLLKNYLFFRVPLLRPANWLERMAPKVAWAFDTRFWLGIGAIAIVGVYLASRQWDRFVHTFAQYTTVSGIVAVAFALTLAKVLHELGHAFTAQRYGCRVPTMGVAFLVMWPVLYTDTNEAWKLADKRQRLHIAAAGVLTELAVAAIATLAWSFLPDGPVRAGAFLLATTTWIFTLAINASPFMRFDGYFLLCDWLDMPNLHSRAFALGRWWLRRLLFGWDSLPPERFPPTRHCFLIVFAFATSIYRLVLFLGIAWLVYHAFFKALGILLFIVEIGWFIALPIFSELQAWWTRRSELEWNRATIRSTLALLTVLAVLVVPWKHGVRAPAVLGAADSQSLFAVAPARVVSNRVARGTVVKAGDLLVQLESPDLMYQLAAAQSRLRQLRWQLDQQPFNEQLLQEGPALQERWAAADAEVSGLEEQLERLQVRAPFASRVVYVNESLVPGAWVASHEELLQVAGLQGAKGEALVGEAALNRLRENRSAVFVAELAEQRHVTCRLGAIDRVNLTVLDSPYLVSHYGGPLRVQTDASGLWVPADPVFRARLTDCDMKMAPTQELRGTVHLLGAATSPVQTLFRRVATTLQREFAQ